MPKVCSTRSAKKNKNKTKNKTFDKRQRHPANLAISTKDRTHYCELARPQIIAALPGILQGLIEKAKGGGYQQAKLLLDLCDVANPAPSQINQQHTQQLCDALLEGLQFPAAQLDNSKADNNAR